MGEGGRDSGDSSPDQFTCSREEGLTDYWVWVGADHWVWGGGWGMGKGSMRVRTEVSLGMEFRVNRSLLV